MTFLVNVTFVLRTFPDECMAWLNRELYSDSCGHTSCNICTLTLFVSNSEALGASNTVHKVIPLYGDFKHCIGSSGRVQSANNEWKGYSEFMHTGSPNRGGIARAVRTVTRL